MGKFLVIPRDSGEALAGLSGEQIESVIAKYHAWGAKLAEAGRMLDGNKLKDGEGRVLSGNASSMTVTHGPYAKAKDVIGGYWVIEAGNYDEAVDLASSNPHLSYGTLEVRSIDPM